MEDQVALLRSFDPPCPWGEDVINTAASRGQLSMIFDVFEAASEHPNVTKWVYEQTDRPRRK